MNTHERTWLASWVVAIFCLIIPILAKSQQHPEESIRQNLIRQNSEPFNRVHVLQLGLSNEVYIQQINSFEPNVVRATQAGHANHINIYQEGYNNFMGATQAGYENVILATMSGTHGVIEMIQIGSNNMISETALISNGRLTIIQEGLYHEVSVSGASDNWDGLRIHQTGNEMKLIIKSY